MRRQKKENPNLLYTLIMNKNRRLKIAILAILLVLSFASVIWALTDGFDRITNSCTDADRASNNCVPAGHCGPKGSLIDQTIDCKTRNYDRKFCTDQQWDCWNTIN